ncbi:hypothetical protein HPB47_019821 [Ixodes persulcatus]|uniref:Uncharacterized protein n=1 Tax=Ixodes persulcatus TaxID=34615 RepID=A0AC60R2Q9_IXOPE|nr:hypothetical protein HPB47_019821 [Ixodes persulcatus]
MFLAARRGNQVWLRDRGATGTILRPGDTPRSYWVRTKDGTFRRNRRQLFLPPDSDPGAEPECQQAAEPADKTTNDASMFEETTPPSEPCTSDHPSTSTQQTAPTDVPSVGKRCPSLSFLFVYSFCNK